MGCKARKVGEKKNKERKKRNGTNKQRKSKRWRFTSLMHMKWFCHHHPMMISWSFITLQQLSRLAFPLETYIEKLMLSFTLRCFYKWRFPWLCGCKMHVLLIGQIISCYVLFSHGVFTFSACDYLLGNGLFTGMLLMCTQWDEHVNWLSHTI